MEWLISNGAITFVIWQRSQATIFTSWHHVEEGATLIFDRLVAISDRFVTAAHGINAFDDSLVWQGVSLADADSG
jgi:hypothetical protein